MHVPRPLFDVTRFVFVLHYNFKRPLTLTLAINRGLQSSNIVLIFFLKDFAEAPNNNNGLYIVQLPIYIRLLTITLYRNKTLIKSICLGVQYQQLNKA